MANGNTNGNGHGVFERWVGLYRAASVCLLGLVIYFLQEGVSSLRDMNAEIKEQGRDITTIRIDGASTKTTLKEIERRVESLEAEKKKLRN